MKTNSILKKENHFIKTHFLIVLFICFFMENGVAQPTNNDSGLEMLFSRINLDYTGLEKVKQSVDNPETALTELINYYKTRTTVHHPANQENENISAKDLKWANDALQHIFVGQSAYPSYFCGDNIDWGSRPVPDNEWVWQLNRMYFWDAMAKVYRETKDEKYAREWCYQLLDWTAKNPRDDSHKYAWRSIEAGIRGYRWTGLFQHFIQSPNFTPEVLVAFLNSCYDHAEFLMTVYRTGSNWGLMEAEGMAFIAITFPEFANAEKWKTEAFRRLNNEINNQVYSDGHQRELAIGYHLGCIGWFYRTYELAKLNKLEKAFPASYLKTIEKMCEVPMKIGMPDGTNVQFGDAWVGTPGQHDEKFMEWAEMFNRSDFLFLGSGGIKGHKPDQTAFSLPESGLYSMRSGWDSSAICLVLKCGPDGGGHCQPDNGTFDVYAGDRNLMPDAGSYIYSGDPENRAWFRQTKVHKTLTLNGEDTKYAPKLLKWQPGNDLDILVVENKSYENLTHRRSVFFVEKRYFIVVDETAGSGTGDVEIHFQLAPGDAFFDYENSSVCTTFDKGWNVMVQTLKQQDLQMKEEEGQVSFVYTKKEPRPAFCFGLKKESAEDQKRFVTLIIPYEKNKPDIKVEVIGNSKIGSALLQLEIKENGKKKTIGYIL